jgi:hypothetical protein
MYIYIYIYIYIYTHIHMPDTNGSCLATHKAEIRRIAVQSQPGKIVRETLCGKYTTQNRVSGVAQVVEHLPSKHEETPVPSPKK